MSTETENEAILHRRLTMANARMAQIEHYLGIRFHQFDPKDDVWGFNQVKDDVLTKDKPQSRFHTGHNRLSVHK